MAQETDRSAAPALQMAESLSAQPGQAVNDPIKQSDSTWSSGMSGWAASVVISFFAHRLPVIELEEAVSADVLPPTLNQMDDEVDSNQCKWWELIGLRQVEYSEFISRGSETSWASLCQISPIAFIIGIYDDNGFAGYRGENLAPKQRVMQQAFARHNKAGNEV